MQSYRLAFAFIGCAALLGCGPHEDPGHGCDQAGAPAACGMSCVGDGSCGDGTYCGTDKTCTADCTASGGCSGGKVCSSRGRCLDGPAPTDGGTPFDRDGACAVLSSQATLAKSPVDVILVIDNSGSMTAEIGAVQTNINTNFAQIIGASGLDYRVILVSHHGKASQDQSICIDMPLSGNATCNPPPAKPVNTTKFFQYSTEIGSNNSFTKILSTYNAADPSGAAAGGWSDWLRPGAFKTFIEITDDKPTDMTAAQFEPALFALTPKNFGDATKRNYVWHSIIGLAENNPVTTPWQPADPIQTVKCTGNGGDAVDVAQEYQKLSQTTGGLRYPICQYTNFDAVFKAVAAGVVASGQVACDFDIPMPPNGDTISLDNIAIAYTPGTAGGAVQYFKQFTSQAACMGDAFYVQAGRIHLCPDTCTKLKADAGAKVDVLFTCDSTIL